MQLSGLLLQLVNQLLVLMLCQVPLGLNSCQWVFRLSTQNITYRQPRLSTKSARYFYSTPRRKAEQRNEHVCLSVGISSEWHIQSLSSFLHMLPVAICHVLPVLWIGSSLSIIGQAKANRGGSLLKLTHWGASRGREGQAGFYDCLVCVVINWSQ